MADLTALGLAESTTNKSTTTLTLNTLVPETVVLGGAKDTIVTDSTVANPDTITGFALVAQAANALAADAARSDVISVEGATVVTFAKLVSTTATTYAGILTEAGASATADLVFHFGGDTYLYSDQGTAGLDDADTLIKLTGTYDLDQLITVAS
jgi:cytoskeletal protein RodZ